MRITPFVSALLLAVTTAGAARANLLVNGSLESAAAPAAPDNLVYVTPLTNNAALPGWTVTTGSVDIVPYSYWQNTNGNFSLDLVGTPGLGSIRQKVNVTAATHYALSFDLSANPQSPPGFNEAASTKILLVQALGNDGSTLLAQQVFFATTGSKTLLDMQYISRSFNFTADGPAATVILSAVQPMDLPAGETRDTIFCGPVIDNLNLVAGTTSEPVPEPATLLSLGLGALLLIARRGTIASVFVNTPPPR